MNENCILIDWLTFTTCEYAPTELVKYLGLKLSDFQISYGFYGYGERMFIPGSSGSGGIAIHYNGFKEDMGVMVDMSGEGCRLFETLSEVGFTKVFTDIVQSPDTFRVTRVDVAYDDKSDGEDYLLEMRTIVMHTIKHKFVSKWSSGIIEDSWKIDKEHMVHALSVRFGSKQSDLYLRIYDKAQERGGLDCHWVRSEIVFKHERAYAFLKEYIENGNIGAIYAGVLMNYLRFVRLDHSRKENCSSAQWWLKFLDYAQKIKLYTPKDIEYNMMKLRNYVVNQSGNSIDTYIKCLGAEQLLEDLKNRKSKLNAKQKFLIQQNEMKS